MQDLFEIELNTHISQNPFYRLVKLGYPDGNKIRFFHKLQ